MLSRRLSLTSDFAEVNRLNQWLDEAFTEAGVSASVADDLKLCLNEAVGNVMLYGFADVAEPEIAVEISLDETSATAIVSDNGKPFDPMQRPAREKLSDLEHDAIGGFGVQLIRQTADSVDYARTDGHNRLRIVCRASD